MSPETKKPSRGRDIIIRPAKEKQVSTLKTCKGCGACGEGYEDGRCGDCRKKEKP